MNGHRRRHPLLLIWFGYYIAWMRTYIGVLTDASIDDRPYRLLTARARTNKSSLCDYLIWEYKYATDTVLQ